MFLNTCYMYLYYRSLYRVDLTLLQKKFRARISYVDLANFQGWGGEWVEEIELVLGEMIFECMQFRFTTQQWLQVFNVCVINKFKNMTQVCQIVLSYWKLTDKC